jgi:plastocyanin
MGGHGGRVSPVEEPHMSKANTTPGRSPARTGFLVAAATLFAIALSACSSGLKHPVHEVTATMADGVQHVEVTAHSYWFEPNRIVVKRGTPVEVRVHNASYIMPHGFACIAPESGLETKQSVGLFGRTKTFRFTPDKPGEYPFFCPVSDHAKEGMKGTLVVQE